MKLRDEWADDTPYGVHKGWLRKGTIFKIRDKKVILSVQASETHHSTPRENWLKLSDCSEVEIALVNANYTEEQPGEKYFFLPSDLGIAGFDKYFSYDIGAYVPLGVVESLADELAKLGTIVNDKEVRA